MSTRATYTFIDQRTCPTTDVCVYIHHDGYPQGAATYLRKWIEGQRTDIASFIRINERAEITRESAHGDTEYHYTIHRRECGDWEIEAYHRPIGEDDFKIFIQDKKLAKFIEEQAA